MIIDCAYYQDGRRQGEGAVPLEEAAARCGQGGFVWLGLFEPGYEELAQVRDTFGLHELAVEDAQNFHMRPKVESYDQDVQLIILGLPCLGTGADTRYTAWRKSARELS